MHHWNTISIFANYTWKWTNGSENPESEPTRYHVYSVSKWATQPPQLSVKILQFHSRVSGQHFLGRHTHFLFFKLERKGAVNSGPKPGSNSSSYVTSHTPPPPNSYPLPSINGSPSEMVLNYGLGKPISLFSFDRHGKGNMELFPRHQRLRPTEWVSCIPDWEPHREPKSLTKN